MDGDLSRGLMTAIGMSIAYGASGLGMLFAWLGYRKQQQRSTHKTDDREDGSNE